MHILVVRQHEAHFLMTFLLFLLCSVIVCALFAIPSHHIWLYYLSPVGNALFSQYKFGCMAVIISCIIEQLAEVPSFITQVNCKLKLRVVLDCVHLTVRSVVFVYLIRSDPTNAITAFAVAQIVSSIVFTLGFYGYYYLTIGEKNEVAQTIALKRFADLFPFFGNQVSHALDVDAIKMDINYVFRRVRFLTATLRLW